MDLPDDMLLEVLMRAPLPTAVSICSTNTKTRQFCENRFWPERIYQDFGRHYQPELPAFLGPERQYTILWRYQKSPYYFTDYSPSNYVKYSVFGLPSPVLSLGSKVITNNIPSNYIVVFAEPRGFIFKLGPNDIYTFLDGFDLANDPVVRMLTRKERELLLLQLLNWILYDNIAPA